MHNARDVEPSLPARSCGMGYTGDRAQRSARPRRTNGAGRGADNALHYAVATTADTFIVHLYGEVDVAAEPVLSELRRALIRLRPTRLVVEATDITFIDCAGYRYLLTVQTAVEAGGGTVVVRAPSPAVSRLTALLTAAVRQLDGAVLQL
jgi:anti-anti-sigma factor